MYHHLENHEEYFARLAKENAGYKAIMLVIGFRVDKQNVHKGEEFGPKHEWNAKVPRAQVVATIEKTGQWKLVKELVFEFHYNLFFEKKT